MNDANCDSRQALWRLSALYAGAFLWLSFLTEPLWIGSSAFPKVPAFNWLTSIPPWADVAVAVAFAVGVLIGTGMTRRWEAFWIAAAAFVLVSFTLNQHRLQVWAYHLSVAGLLAACSAPGRAIPRLRWLTIGIYAWSAVSKLDAGFVAGPGRTLLGGVTSVFWMNPPSGAFEKYGPWLMPIGEVLTAIALAVPRWRSIGLWLSIAMHLLLLLAVGPLGLNHELGVQLWNGVFLIQNFMLFRCPTFKVQSPSDPVALPRRRSIDRLMRGLVAIVIVMPAFQPWGYWDVWPSWAVYSARGGWTTSFIHHDDVTKLPADVQAHIREPAPLSDWHPIDIDAWSLSELHCPVYPQPRFRLAVAAALSRFARIQVERRSPPDRTSGATRVQTIEVVDGQLPPGVAAEFWLNTVPRDSVAR